MKGDLKFSRWAISSFIIAIILLIYVILYSLSLPFWPIYSMWMWVLITFILPFCCFVFGVIGLISVKRNKLKGKFFAWGGIIFTIFYLIWMSVNF